jgi:hypothetical protein
VLFSEAALTLTPLARFVAIVFNRCSKTEHLLCVFNMPGYRARRYRKLRHPLPSLIWQGLAQIQRCCQLSWHVHCAI